MKGYKTKEKKVPQRYKELQLRKVNLTNNWNASLQITNDTNNY